jgi:predicted nucleic acid-binding protein
VDADVLFAGSASTNEHSASLLILRLSEVTLIEALTSQQVITEVERNLEVRLPAALPAFRLLVSRSLRVVPDPQQEQVDACAGQADPKDLPILVAAQQAGCAWLVTFNVRHFQPGHSDLVTLTPGEFILRLRYLLAELTVAGKE